MEYLEFLEHMRSFIRAYEKERETIAACWMAQTGQDIPPNLRRSHWIEAVESEIQAERQRGELALRLSEPPPQEALERSDRARSALSPHQTATEATLDPWRCAQCGDVIYYGERQHVCRGRRNGRAIQFSCKTCGELVDINHLGEPLNHVCRGGRLAT